MSHLGPAPRHLCLLPCRARGPTVPAWLGRAWRASDALSLSLVFLICTIGRLEVLPSPNEDEIRATESSTLAYSKGSQNVLSQRRFSLH